MIFLRVFYWAVLWGMSVAFCAEVDQFTVYGDRLLDSTKTLNHKTNAWVSMALEDVTGKGCNQETLYEALADYFSSLGKSAHVRGLIYGHELHGSVPQGGETIYQDFLFAKRIGYIIGKVIHVPPLAQVIRLGGVTLGTDKLEHMWRWGYLYFKDFYLEGASLEETLGAGWEIEHSWLGIFISHVMSYGDLVANFNGMRFWNHLLQENEDILGENLGPYIQCENNRWVQVKKIDWSEYVDKGMDESVNCSLFNRDKHLTSVTKRIKILSQEKGKDLTCPVASSREKKFLQAKYGFLSSHLLNFQGHASLEGGAFFKESLVLPTDLH